MGLALFLRKQLCRYHYRCHSYRHRHAMYPTQQPDQYFRHLPVCLQSGKYDFHDHLLHRRLFGYLPCGSSWRTWGWSGVVGTGVILTIISLSITFTARNNKDTIIFPSKRKDLIIFICHAKDKEDIEQNCYTFVASNYKRQINNRFVNQA